MNNAALAWIMFYIAAALVGIFLTLVYITTTKKPHKKSR